MVQLALMPLGGLQPPVQLAQSSPAWNEELRVEGA